VNLESLAARAAFGKITNLEVRDALVEWFAALAEPQIRQGLRYTSPTAGPGEVRRLLHQRSLAFFHGLDSTFDDPLLADLRRVKTRMDSYLRVSGPAARQKSFDDPRWASILGNRAA
jgi:hypothetical protein